MKMVMVLQTSSINVLKHLKAWRLTHMAARWIQMVMVYLITRINNS